VESTDTIDDELRRVSAEVDVLRARLDEAVGSNNGLKKENSDLKNKLAVSLSPEQTQRLKNDNKRFLSLTERINNQRQTMEDRLKEKKQELQDTEEELKTTNEKLESVIADRDKVKRLVEGLLAETDKLRQEIVVLKDGKSFADFVELKRQIKCLKDENTVLSNGLTSDQKGTLRFNLNDIATMLKIDKSNCNCGEDLTQRRYQSQRVVVLDEMDTCPVSYPDQRVPCCSESPFFVECNKNTPRSPMQATCNIQRRISLISPPRTAITPLLRSSAPSFRDNRRRNLLHSKSLPGTAISHVPHVPVVNQNYVGRRKSKSPRWPTLVELRQVYNNR